MADTPDRCPRCGGGFRCGANDDVPCPCSTIVLDAALQQRLRQRYTGCLCIACLARLTHGEALGSALNEPL